MAPCRGVLLALLSFTVRRTDGFCGNSRSTATTSTITTSTATGSTPPIRTLVASCAAKKAKSSSFEDNPFGDPFGDPFSDAYGDEMADDAAPQSSASPAQKQLFADGGSSSSSSSDGGLDSSGDARRARQGAIRDVLGARQPHQRRDKVFPGSRVLLMLSSDLKGLSAEALKAAAEAAEEDESGEPFCPVEVTATGRKFGEAGVKKMRRAVEEQRQAVAAAKQMAEQLGAESQAEGNSRPKPTRPAGSKAPYQKKRRKKKGGLGDRGQNFR